MVAAFVVLLGAACASLAQKEQGERLFFAVQIEDGGRVIARPRMIGQTGKRLTLRLVTPEAPDRARLALELVPEREGSGYRIQLGVALPERASTDRGELALGHGEERLLELDDPVRPVIVRVLVMRVGSPELDAYLELAGALPQTS